MVIKSINTFVTASAMLAVFSHLSDTKDSFTVKWIILINILGLPKKNSISMAFVITSALQSVQNNASSSPSWSSSLISKSCLQSSLTKMAQGKQQSSHKPLRFLVSSSVLQSIFPGFSTSPSCSLPK